MPLSPRSLLHGELVYDSCLSKGLHFYIVWSFFSIFPKLSQATFHFLLLYYYLIFDIYFPLSSYFDEITFSLTCSSKNYSLSFLFASMKMDIPHLSLLVVTALFLEENYPC